MKTIIVAVMALLIGCGSESQKAAPEPDGGDGPGPYELSYTDVMEFTRGVASTYEVSGSFKRDDTTTITIDGMPEGAVFDAGAITWTPSCNLSPENGQFSRGYQVYRLRINMQGSRSDNIVQKPAIMLVHLTGDDSPCED